ncbi:MAG: glycosyltransferase family 2 protein [Anaerolineae bacterium]|nr:glycosyltransferase family 2 protein [Anaerolineae bacterium]
MSDAAPTPIRHLGIVVVSYNVRELLVRCLSSIGSELARSPRLEAQVWVVDNASVDGSAEMVREQFPWVRLIASAENLGFARANNRALREIGFPEEPDVPDAVLLLNPDAELLPGALSEMVQCLDAHPRAAVVGPQLQYGDGRFQHGAFRFPSLAQVFLDFFPLNWRLTESRINGRYPKALYAAGQPFPVDFVLGASMMVRAEAIRQVGLLDEGYFMYAEEMDWCRRFYAAGWSVYCAPAARVIHHEGQSARQFRDRMYVALWRSRYRFFHRYYPAAWRVLARSIVRVGLWAEARRARQAMTRGDISREEMDRRLAAYREVARL